MNFSIINSKLDSQLRKISPNACRIVAPVLIKDLNKRGLQNDQVSTVISEKTFKEVYRTVVRDLRAFGFYSEKYVH